MNPSNTGTLRPRNASPMIRRRSIAADTEDGIVEVVPSLRTRTMSGSWGGVNESDEDEATLRDGVCVDVSVPSVTVRQPRSSVNGSGDSGYSGRKLDQSDYELPDYDNMTVEEKLRRKLKFFFMNPVEKFIARRQTPWKLFLQFAKVIFVTVQVMLFGYFRHVHTNFHKDSQITFEHLFFKTWDSVREITAYPPSVGTYALYKKDTFYELFNEAALVFRTLEETSVTPLKKNSTLNFCVLAYEPKPRKGIKDGENVHKQLFGEHFAFTHRLGDTRCISIPDEKLLNFSSLDYLKGRNFEVPWTSLHQMHLNFSVRTYTFKDRGAFTGTECFLFKIYITFDNSDHDGQIPIQLDLRPTRIRCDDPHLSESDSNISIRVLNYVVAAMCILSFVLCLRAIVRAQLLRAETKEFFRAHFRTDLSLNDQLQFLNLWYVVICINDIFIVIGSVITELIEEKESTADLWDFSCIFLGTGNLLVWIGMLRYLGFFEAYNALILTLKGSLPNVARFAMCAAFVYAGYLFCGWLVFAPYHFKFRSLQSTSECLFSLINGDDMFATFSMMSEKVGLIHTFSRIYLYTFVMLFIYVILSLFIAIIMDTYENIKEFYVDGFPKSKLDEFYTSRDYDPFSTSFYDGSSPGILYLIWCWTMTKLYGRRWKGYDRMIADGNRNNQGDIEHDQSPILT